MSHTIEVTEIPDHLLKLLDERVKQKGVDRATYIRGLIVQDIQAPTLRDLFAPIRADIRASGLSDDEVDALLEEAREEAHHARTAPPSAGVG